MDENQALGRAAGLIRRGEHAAAEELLREVLRANPRSETAWLWMAVVESDPARQCAYLDRVLALNPQHEGAQRLLATLERQEAAQGSIETAPSRAEGTAAGQGRTAGRSPRGEGAEVCPQCGEATRAGARFCTRCGYRLGGPTRAGGQDHGGVKVPEEVDPVAVKLEAARRDLLDMSLYNRLLNYRPLKSKGLEFVGADPATVYKVLVVEERKMSFLSASEEVAAEGRYYERPGTAAEDGAVAVEEDGAVDLGQVGELAAGQVVAEGHGYEPEEGGSGSGEVAAKGRDYEQEEQESEGVAAELKAATTNGLARQLKVRARRMR
jgi:hypothetical protein